VFALDSVQVVLFLCLDFGIFCSTSVHRGRYQLSRYQLVSVEAGAQLTLSMERY